MEANIFGISNRIPTSNPLSPDLITKWESVIPHLAGSNIVRTAKIPNVTAKKYTYDMTGLLIFLGVSKEFHYPTMRVNGYYSYKDYHHDNIYIHILDNKQLNLYHKLFTTTGR